MEVRGNKITGKERVFVVPKPNINPKSEQATCLSCGSTIRYIDPKTGKHYLENKKLSKEVSTRLEWYVKYVLNKYNQGDDAAARQRLLVKVKIAEEGLRFEPCDDKDQAKLASAEREVHKLIQAGEVDVPMEQFAPYKWRHGNVSL